MKLGPALHTHGRIAGVNGVRILKVLTPEEAALTNFPPAQTLLWQADANNGYAGSISATPQPLAGSISICGLRDAAVVQPGDVIRLREGGSLVSVLYRRGSTANTLFVTERCNSLCVMCSQPPRDEDDSWRIDEILQTLALIDQDEVQLGFTGGEPTLLGADFARVLQSCRDLLPNTHLHVLTNGRAFSDQAFARTLTDAGDRQTTWAVPLYADVASDHDEIVGACGAFDETVQGLFELAQLRARVEIRIVLHAMSFPRLPQLASYIYRRLPFAEHVTFMGLEPMGLAKVNRHRVWIDPADYADELSAAVEHLAARGMTTSIYNLPYCVLPRALWPFARQSISDWKNIADPACELCSMKQGCSGFFASTGPSWRSRSIAPIPAEECRP